MSPFGHYVVDGYFSDETQGLVDQMKDKIDFGPLNDVISMLPSTMYRASSGLHWSYLYWKYPIMKTSEIFVYKIAWIITFFLESSCFLFSSFFTYLGNEECNVLFKSLYVFFPRMFFFCVYLPSLFVTWCFWFFEEW